MIDHFIVMHSFITCSIGVCGEEVDVLVLDLLVGGRRGHLVGHDGVDVVVKQLLLGTGHTNLPVLNIQGFQ